MCDIAEEAMASIAYIYGLSLPNRSANSGAVLGLLSALARLQYPVRIIYPSSPDSTASAISDTYCAHPSIVYNASSIPKGVLRNPSLAKALGKRCRPADVVITRMPQVAVLTTLLGRHTILELHQNATTFKNWKWWRLGLHAVRRSRLSVATVSKGVLDTLDPLLRKMAVTAIVVPSATSDLLLKGGRTARHDVGYVGSYMSGKGIEMVEVLARSLPQYTFVIYGDPAKSPEIAARFDDLPNVTLGGFVRPRDIASALASFRIGLAPYARAGFGELGSATVRVEDLSSLKIVEYMSAQRAIVASRLPAVAAMVAHRREALLCEPDDPTDWAAALTELLEDSSLRTELAAQARARYEREFSFDVRAAHFVRLIAGDTSASTAR